MKKTKLNIYQYNTLLNSLELKPKLFINLAINKKSNAIKHLPCKEKLINTIWKKCAIVFIIMLKSKRIRSKTLCNIMNFKKPNWIDFLNELSILKQDELNTLHIYLFQMLLYELIIKENTYKSFWSPNYKELSNNLLLPIKKDCVDLSFSQLTEVKKESSQSLTINKINIQSNINKNYYQLSTSTVLNKCENENSKMKVIKILKVPIKPNQEQQKHIDEWINTSTYIYNKTFPERES